MNGSLRFWAVNEVMNPHLSPTTPHDMDEAAAAAVAALADNLMGMIGVARALAMCGRHVDLSGLSSSAGLLCAKALDLPPDHGRTVRPKLALLRNDLDALSAVLRTCRPA